MSLGNAITWKCYIPTQVSFPPGLSDLEPQLPFDLQGKTFNRIFGTATALFERFVLERKVMGPCWLQVVDPDFSKAQNVNSSQGITDISLPGRVLNLEFLRQIRLLRQ
jgi:hypothetical protein